MAGQAPHHTEQDCQLDCIIMHDADDPLVSVRHVIDAVIVAGIVFFAVLLGDAMTALLNGGELYLSVHDVKARIVSAALAFAMTFLTQWARARGIEFKEALLFGSGGE